MLMWPQLYAATACEEPSSTQCAGRLLPICCGSQIIFLVFLVELGVIRPRRGVPGTVSMSSASPPTKYRPAKLFSLPRDLVPAILIGNDCFFTSAADLARNSSV